MLEGITAKIRGMGEEDLGKVMGALQSGEKIDYDFFCGIFKVIMPDAPEEVK